MIHKKTNPALIGLLIAAMLFFWWCTKTPPLPEDNGSAIPDGLLIRVSAATEEAEAAGELEAAEPEEEVETFLLTFRTEDGEEITTMEVPYGESPAYEPVPEDMAFLGWDDGNGRIVNVTTFTVTYDMTFIAVTGPEMSCSGAYINPDTDGLFYPDRELTRSDTSRAVYEMFVVKPSGETFLNDVMTNARCYKSATTLVTAGYMELTDGAFRPDEAITRDEFISLLKKLFYNTAVDEATEDLGETVTRGEACVIFNSLLGIEDAADGPYYPDVSPSGPYYGAVSAAGIESTTSWLVNGERRTGFVNIEGYLYYFDDEGYLSCSTTIGTLEFDSSGRYTSGDAELDAKVAEIISENVKNSQSQEDKLKTVYNYVRDNFLYLRRNYYDVGETGWEIDEAKTMFTKGSGNCYNFAAIFWALSRGIGYDTHAVSGLMRAEPIPHAWCVICDEDGSPYIYDPEVELEFAMAGEPRNMYMWKIDMERSLIWTYQWMENGVVVKGDTCAGVFVPTGYVKQEETEETAAETE